ncbi:serine hydrolase domain-containing protein [Salegentibacter chungangensis]|uniref:Serine hydrolase domain-containing protein n=1 Tax=Salegentibacter chungangensis TaxID=1335724 RepID=A0ABW3NP24_9FLAO
MKKFLRFLGYLFLFLFLAILLLYLFGYDYILKGARVTYLTGHKTAYIDDYPHFTNRLIQNDENNEWEWPVSSEYNETPATKILDSLNKELGTIAFLIIKNDSVWFEEYYKDYGPDSKTNSFSMAKSITSALLGKAIKDGYIKSLDQPVADFYPQFDNSLTVGDLSSMASGLNWDESYYNPFGQTARAYFDNDIRKLILELKVTGTPGKSFKYLSGNTALLGMIISKATGKTLSEYLSQSFWKPMGMKSDALWQIDSKKSGMEKAYCCIASNARDFARFGKLYNHSGNWEGRQLLDSSFVKNSINPRFKDSPEYGYGLWLSDYRNKDIFYMRGILGQYVITIPEDHMIIVRLGEKLIRKKEGEQHAPDFYHYIDETYKMLKDAT